MAKATTKMPISPDLYRQTLEQLNLQSICLNDLKASCDREVLKRGQVAIDISYNASDQHADTNYYVLITCTLKGMQEKMSVLSIEATFRVIFNTEAMIPEGFFEVYQQVNLRMTILPYLRELVASITSRMDLPVLTLPYYIPASKVKAQEASKLSKDVDAIGTSRRSFRL